MSYSGCGMDTPKINQHHRLSDGLRGTKMRRVRLDQPGEHVIGDILSPGDGVDPRLDNGTGDFVYQLPASQDRSEVDGEAAGNETGPCLVDGTE